MPARLPLVKNGSTWQLLADIKEDHLLHEHIDWMVGYIQSNKNHLIKLLEGCVGELTLVSMCRTKEEFNFGAYFDRNSLALLSEVGLSLDIDVYFLGQNR